jgi:hypothetical protein
MSIGMTEVLSAKDLPPRERWFVGALRIFSAFAILSTLSYVVTMVWAQHEFSLTESVVDAHSSMLARNGTLYYGLKDYPYTVCGYTPIFYLLDAAIIRIGVPALLAGRLISFIALLASIALCWRLVLVYTGNRYAAWIAVLLASSSVPLLNWGTIGVVDMLAVTLSITAFYEFSRFSARGESTLVWAGLLAAAAFFTKQSMLAGPAAMFILLLFRNRKTALLFAAALGGSIAALALGINTALHGRFFTDTVFAMMQPYAAGKVMQHVGYIAFVSGGLIVAFAATLRHLARSRSAPLLVYFGISTLLLLIMAPKTGSDSNYHLEPTFLLIACTCAGLFEMNFFELCFRNSKSWITLLQAPVVLFLVMNYRIMVPDLIARFWREHLLRTELTAVKPYFSNISGRIFSADLDPMVQLRGRLDIEPVIYGLLVTAGRIDPEPLRKDLSRAAIPLVILYEDLAHPIPDPSLEIPRLPPADLNEIRQHYRLAEHIPGPYLGGIYIYLPLATR